MKILSNCNIFTGEEFLYHHAVITENEKIIRVCPAHDIESMDYMDMNGALLVPGLIDLQVNGGGGVLFNDTPTKAGIECIYAAHSSEGTACICPTFITDSMEKLEAAIYAVDDTDDLKIPAIHIEGFLISKEKSGIHDPRYILNTPNIFFDKIKNSGFRRKLLTIAPEVLSASQLEELKAMGCIVFGGHTNADFDCFTEFLCHGGVGATHLFNAMSQLGSRSPGVCGAVMNSHTAVAGIIADGHHVHFSCVKIAKKLMGDRLFLVSDAMPPACSHMEKYNLYGEEIHVKNDVCVSGAGTIAGSKLCMLKAVKNAVDFCEISPCEALRMGSLYPAQVLKRNDLGRIKAGYCACFTVTNEAFSTGHALIIK